MLARLDHRLPLRRRAHTPDHEFPVLHAANHVHVDHGDSVCDRDYGVINVVIRTE